MKQLPKFQIALKISGLLLTLFFFSVFAGAANSQNQKINIVGKNLTVKELIRQVESQTDFLFVYSESEIDLDLKANVSSGSYTVEQCLNEAIRNTDVNYSFESGYIVLTKAASGKKTQSPQSSISVRGVIKDSQGQPVAGASILVKDTQNGTFTDANGEYFLIDVPADAVLQISFIGFETQEISVNSRSVVNVQLKEDTEMLNEVVVVGYGTRTRRSITGAVDQVNSDAFKDRPVSNATQALQGASANLIIQNRNANPNDNSMNINIRGVSTMGNNDPLIVIDGLISSSSTLNTLNPNDIENVSVLKDAGSAAIYGSRSANGVILVTTKKGSKSTKPVFTFSGQVGAQEPHILFHPVKGWQNAMLRDQANINVGGDPQFTPAQIRDLAEHEDKEEWYYDQIIKTALQQNYNFSVTGGSDNTTYLVSAGYYNQRSNFVGNYGVERYNFRTNITTEYGRLKLTSQLAYNRRNNRNVAGGTGNVIINSSRIPPYYYYQFKKDGKYLVNDVVGDDNTMALLKDGGYEKSDNDNVIGSLNMDVKIIDGLKATGLVGLDLTQYHRFRRDLKVPLYSSADLENPVLYMHSNTFVQDYNSKYYTLSTQFLLDFDRTFAEVHNVTAMLGVSNESYTSRGSQIGWKYTDEDLGLPTTDDSIQDTGNYNTNAGTDQTSITSFFGRTGYNYKDRYYADFAFRYDGSSKFAKDKRWGFFPSISGGWRISEEPFMDTYKSKLGDLKLRASYGVLGNQNVDNYSYQTVYQMYNNVYTFNGTTVPGTGFTYGNTDLTWEKSANLNIGADATFLHGNLYLSVDYFHKVTSDILLSPEVSSTFGASAAKENAGKMKNEGFEVTANYRLKTGDFYHNFSFNLADSKNEVTDFGGKERIDQNDQLYKLIREGEALGSYYGYTTDGFFQSYEDIDNSALPVGASVQPGDVKYVDQNNDGVINEKDRVVLGNAFPRFTYGFTYSFEWKGIDFNLMIQGVGKRSMYLRGELIEPFHSNYSYCIYKHQLDFWTPSNPDARWPRLVAPGSSSSTNNWWMTGSDIYLLDASYLRVKNITIGYTLPKAWTTKVGLQRVRTSLTAENPFFFTKNSFVDPESTEFGNNMGGIGSIGANSGRNYPSLSYYGFGVEIEF
ncbi:MAG: TonB-dependent receptor [Bacteroidales bacterium]|nr:TonB-dependent receptor [Bacteroidales bacterium]MDY6001202.1 TonB-dependent receptor [Candidatus Cryptobacteroides sp.]